MCIYMHMHKCVYMKKREKQLFIDKFMLAIVLNSKDMLTKNENRSCFDGVHTLKHLSLPRCFKINECLFLISVKVCL